MNVHAIRAIYYFELARAFRTLMQSIASPVLSTSLYFVVFGTAIGSRMGTTRLQVDVPRLVDLYLEGRLKLDELITARYPLERINEAIEAMERGEALRNVIVF